MPCNRWVANRRHRAVANTASQLEGRQFSEMQSEDAENICSAPLEMRRRH